MGHGEPGPVTIQAGTRTCSWHHQCRDAEFTHGLAVQRGNGRSHYGWERTFSSVWTFESQSYRQGTLEASIDDLACLQESKCSSSTM